MHNTYVFLSLLEQKSPAADMGPDFKGSHHIVLGSDQPANLLLHIWRNGRCWPVKLHVSDMVEIEVDPQKVVDEILRQIDDKNAELSKTT